MPLTLAPVTPNSLSVTRIEPFNTAGVIGVQRDYGARGDAATNDSTRIQAALVDAETDGIPVFFEPGTYLTGTINYRLQALMGAGRRLATLRNLPGQDIFHLDPTLAYDGAATNTSFLRGFKFLIDDGDAAAPAAFNTGAYKRGGAVGPAGIAVDFPDGSAIRQRLNNFSVEDCLFTSVSSTAGGLNGACGIYQQFPWAQSVADSLWFYRLAYGWRDAGPVTNPTGTSISSDHNQYRHLFFNGCGSAARFVNLTYCDFHNLAIQICPTGLELVSFTSAVSTFSAAVYFDTVMIEEASTLSASFEGTDIRGRNITFVGTCARPVFASHSGEWLGVHAPNVVSGNEIDITGNYNRFDGVATSNVGKINNTGTGNTIIQSRYRSATIGDRVYVAGSPYPWVVDIDVFGAVAAQVNWASKAYGAYAYGGILTSNSGAQNESVSFDVVLEAGTWIVDVTYTKGANNGIFTITVGGVSAGTIDSYAAAGSNNNLTSTGGFQISESGKKRVTLTMATKNASSGSYYGQIQHLQLRRVG